MKTKDMARDTGASDRPSLYAQVTDRIIAELEAGRLPWVQPWDRAKASAGLPRNAGTGRAYSGVNVLILWAAVIERGYGGQAWLTYRQCEALGGHVRKGEAGTTVCYADRFTPKSEKERATSNGDEARQVAFLKRFTVFNIDQCEGLPETLAGIAEPLPEREIIPYAEALVAATGADIRIGGDRAFYAPAPDYVAVPFHQLYHHQIDWYRTVFHELGQNAAPPIMPSGVPRRADSVGSPFSAFGIILMPLPARSERLLRGRVRRVSRKPLIFSVLRSTTSDWRRRAPKITRDPLASLAKIMPNARSPELEKSASLKPSFGIIRDAALWPLCRIRHNGHWTGHASRLDRDQSGRFGDAFYAREELVAEMASAFVCAELTIQPTVRHADYIGSWLAVLRENNRAIFRAASQASKAADTLLGFQSSPLERTA